MAMEKEALTHKIEDDLAARNRNWDKIETHMAESASDDVHGIGFKGAVVRLGSNVSIPNNSFSLVPWGNVIYDTHGIYNPSNPTRLTVPEGVSYVKISTNIFFLSNSTGSRRIRSMANGGAHSQRIYVAYPANSGADTRIMAASAPMPVSPGTYFEIEVFQDSGGALDLLNQTGTWFALEVIR